MQKRLFAILSLLLCCWTLCAQNEQSVTGMVLDKDNAPLAGVRITAELGDESAVTDPDGRFEITIEEGEKLQFSLQGLETVLMPAKDGMTVSMQKSASGKEHPDSYIRLAAGYPVTQLDAQLGFAGKKGNSLVLKADHDARWGFKTLEWSALSAEFVHRFEKSELYAKAGGANLFFTRYGRYFSKLASEPSTVSAYPTTPSYVIQQRYNALQPDDRQSIWRATATIGIRSDKTQALQYKAELSCQSYTYQDMMTEYQVCGRLNIEHHWIGEGIQNQKIGANIYSENRWVGLSDSTAAYYERRQLVLTPMHAMRIEPFYAYRGERFSIHLGVNLDFNIGKGNLNSLTTNNTPLEKQVAFAPSPNVRMKLQIAKWAILYADVLGTFSTSSMTGYVRLNPYINVIGAPSSHHVSGYTPVDARIGLQLRPHDDLLMQLDAGYRYVLNSVECTATQNSDGLHEWNMMGLAYVDFQRWKTGIELTYHYKQYFLMQLTGDAFIYRHIKHNTTGAKLGDRGTDFCTEGRSYDHPLWEVSARLEGHPDSHWTIYSDNSIQGRRWAITSIGDRQLPAFINMDIGAGYQFGNTGNDALDRLQINAEIRNILNRRNMVWYGYESEGIMAQLGLRYMIP